VNGDNITFTSTGISGSPASFKYHVKNSLNTTQTGTVFFNITPLPTIEALIYNNSDSFNSAKASLTPPTQLDIFNTWGRTDGNNYYENGSVAAGSAAAWQLLTNPDRISQPQNTSTACGFISLDRLDNYTFEATVTSPDADNDSIGLIIAFNRDAGTNQTLSIIRTQGGTQPNNGFGMVYGDSGASTSWVIQNISVGGVLSGWSNAQSRIKVQRQGDIIQAWCTNWNDVNNYQVTSQLTLDLNSDPRLAKFKGNQHYGYYTLSQAGSTYLNISFKGSLNYNEMYNLETGMVSKYIDGVGWVDTTERIQDRLGYIRTVTNPLTGESFIIKENTIEYLGIV
jgi:hypothetical protein